MILSRYKDHAQRMYDHVRAFVDHAFLMTGNNSKKHKQIREEMQRVPNDESLLLVAVGGLIGEGFDYPRLDTLIMGTPVSL